jgi:nucleoside-diphosphate-sugar epimerase
MRRRWYRDLIDEMREENRARREEHERWLVELRVQAAEQQRRFDAIDAAMENDKRVTRDMIIDLREQTAILRDARQGIQANTEGLLRILDEMRRNDGPSPAGA